MRRGRSQTMWRYMPGATFRYGESGPWCRVIAITLKNSHQLEGALAEALATALRRWDAAGPGALYPDPVESANRYIVGEPNDVRYDLWPFVFTCRGCGRLHYYQSLENLKRINEHLACDSCRGQDRLRQVGYGFVCECGQLDTLFAPSHPREHPIRLVDQRSFRDSHWYCTVCRTPLMSGPRAGLGFRPCSCRPGKLKRGVILEDSRVYFSQTLDLVDIEPASLEPWRDNPGLGDVLLAAALGISEYRPSHLQDLARRLPDAGLSPEMQAMRDMLIGTGMPETQADMMVRQAVTRGGGDAWGAYTAALVPHRDRAGSRDWATERRTVEYVFVRDDPAAACVSLDTLIDEARAGGFAEAAARLASERDLARAIGLVNLRVVGELPVLLAAIGYTRWRSNPLEADDSSSVTPVDSTVLRPFPDVDLKLPIYAVRNTTEALMYEVDPWRVAAFLSANTETETPVEVTTSEPGLRAWLLGLLGYLVDTGEAHLVLRPWESGRLNVDEVAALAFGVLHTLSHVLKVTAHRYVGIDADALAEYLFPGHMAGLLYASSQVTFTLGGIDAVFRSNLTQWLGSARDYAGVCSFDPVCESSGGACLACLYPKFGCAYFNRTVSRAFLVGGQVVGREQPLEGFWSAKVSHLMDEMRSRGRASG